MSTFYLVYQDRSPEPMGPFTITDDLVQARYVQRVLTASSFETVKIARIEGGEVVSAMWDAPHVEDGETS